MLKLYNQLKKCYDVGKQTSIYEYKIACRECGHSSGSISDRGLNESLMLNSKLDLNKRKLDVIGKNGTLLSKLVTFYGTKSKHYENSDLTKIIFQN